MAPSLPSIFSSLLALASVRVALGLNLRQSIAKSKILDGPDDVKGEYDYIVVGGGTAGLTVADRLTESGDCEQTPKTTCLC